MIDLRVVACIALAGCARPPPTTPAAAATDAVVRVTLRRPTELEPGARASIELHLVVAPGHHIQSDHPSRPNFIPTRVSLAWDDPATPIDVAVAEYPEATPFAFDGDHLATFEGELDVRIPIVAHADARPGEYVAHGEVRYQACTATSCLFPRGEPFVAVARVTGAHSTR